MLFLNYNSISSPGTVRSIPNSSFHVYTLSIRSFALSPSTLYPSFFIPSFHEADYYQNILYCVRTIFVGLHMFTVYLRCLATSYTMSVNWLKQMLCHFTISFSREDVYKLTFEKPSSLEAINSMYHSYIKKRSLFCIPPLYYQKKNMFLSIKMIKLICYWNKNIISDQRTYLIKI